MLGGLGGPELLLILAVILLLFGAKRLPQLANALGSSVGSFKKGLKEGSTETQVVETEAQKLPENIEA